MSRKQVELGGLYAIPSLEKFGLAKVIYMPKDFRNVVLIRLFQHAYPSLEDMGNEFPARNDHESVLYYTGDGAIRAGGWHYLRKESVGEKERALTKRIIGGSVWVEDNRIGPASDADMANLQQMSVYPYKLVEKIVSRLDLKRALDC
jgi:hypothetical protein